MELLYTWSYLALIGATLFWFYFEAREKSTVPVNIVFWSALGLYLVSFFFGGCSIMHKALFVLPRDVGVFLLCVLLGNNLAKKTGVFALLMTILIAVVKFFFFGVLHQSLVCGHTHLDPGAELLIDIKNERQLAEVESTLNEYGASAVRAFPNLRHESYSNLDDYYTTDIPDDHRHDIDEIIEALYETGAVDWVEGNEIVSLSPPNASASDATELPTRLGVNDPMVEKLWGFGPMNIGDLYKQLGSGAFKARKTALIAILDTGVDADHEDLQDNYISTNPRFDRDVQGHGTHCAGIAGAVSNNGKGISSFAPENGFVRVTSIKVLSDDGTGSQKSIIRGMIRAADNGADVLSMSLGGQSTDPAQRAYEEAVKYAGESGAIVVAAAGNSNEDARRHVPAGCQGVITVAAIDPDLNKAAFSNYVNDIAMGVAAPGVDIYSTFPGNSYQALNGTSMATPYVAGLLGLMKAIHPDLTTENAYKILQTTGTKTNDPEETGPLIQPLAALDALHKAL